MLSRSGESAKRGNSFLSLKITFQILAVPCGYCEALTEWNYLAFRVANHLTNSVHFSAISSGNSLFNDQIA